MSSQTCLFSIELFVLALTLPPFSLQQSKLQSTLQIFTTVNTPDTYKCCLKIKCYHENWNGVWIHLNLSWRRPLSYGNQSIDLLRKSMDWFLCENGLRHEEVNIGSYIWRLSFIIARSSYLGMTLLKVTLLHRCFSRSLNCTNSVPNFAKRFK